MNEIEETTTQTMNGNGETSLPQPQPQAAPETAIPVNNDDDGPIVIEGESVTVTLENVDATQPGAAGISNQDLRAAADTMADAMTDVDTAVSITDDPEFDKLQAFTRFVVGGALEGVDEFTQRLELWEAYIRGEMPEPSPDLSEASERDLIRYGLIGFIFESEDTGRKILKSLLKVPGGVARTAVRPTKSVANSRFTGPIRRRLDRMADRGESQILRWIERGHAEEPLSRNLARLGVQEITDEFINQLAQNEEVKELVQEQSMGLAGEAVDQVRERTFSADTLVERIARAVTRRSPRLEPPMADLSEYHGGKIFFEEDNTE
ncbi:MAG: hypothetical protein IAF02_18275 [Anaerolineae bacterium]|nr:hypothetical protein [Anaerolineae bacterium]